MLKLAITLAFLLLCPLFSNWEINGSIGYCGSRHFGSSLFYDWDLFYPPFNGLLVEVSVYRHFNNTSCGVEVENEYIRDSIGIRTYIVEAKFAFTIAFGKKR